MPKVKTLTIAAELNHGGIALHNVVYEGGERPSDVDIARSLNRAGLGVAERFVVIDHGSLPSRDQRDAWVLEGDKVVVDPSRIKPNISRTAKVDDASGLIAVVSEMADHIAEIKRRHAEDVSALNDKINDALRASVAAAHEARK